MDIGVGDEVVCVVGWSNDFASVEVGKVYRVRWVAGCNPILATPCLCCSRYCGRVRVDGDHIPDNAPYSWAWSACQFRKRPPAPARDLKEWLSQPVDFEGPQRVVPEPRRVALYRAIMRGGRERGWRWV